VQFVVINSLVYMYCTEDVSHLDCNKLYFRGNSIDIEWILPTEDGLPLRYFVCCVEHNARELKSVQCHLIRKVKIRQADCSSCSELPACLL
jgi:hypothetical protein